jgi:hypothetical protein
MRACFLGQNICALGYGVATLQAPPLVMDEPAEEPLAAPTVGEHVRDEKNTPAPLLPPSLGTHPLQKSPL